MKGESTEHRKKKRNMRKEKEKERPLEKEKSSPYGFCRQTMVEACHRLQQQRTVGGDMEGS